MAVGLDRIDASTVVGCLASAGLGLWLAISAAPAVAAAPADEAGRSDADPVSEPGDAAVGQGELGVTGAAVPESAPPPPPDAVGSVELDRLLTLPSSMRFDQEKRNGATSDVWRSRFRASFAEIQKARDELAQTKVALDELAETGGGGGQWQMAPPGANNTEVTPMSFKLREELRTGRESLERAEQKHRELTIQADLAGVPEAWRQAN